MKALAIFPNNNETLPALLDEAYKKYQEAESKQSVENKEKSIDELLADFDKRIVPEDMKKYWGLVEIFANKLKKPLTKYQNKKYDVYEVEDVGSIKALLEYFDRGIYDNYPDSLITPECEWLASYAFKTNKEWEDTVEGLLDKYKDMGVVAYISYKS